MVGESRFHLAFWIVFGGMIAIQAWFAARERQGRGRRPAGRKAIGREARGTTVLLAVRGVCLAAFLVMYATGRRWIEVLAMPFPDWLRWMGGGLGIASLALYAWSRVALGRAWSSRLRIHDAQGLVTSGPYARIRHPIYSAMILFMTSIVLIAANWFLVAFLAVSVLDLALRIPKEERMMIEVFGDAYEAYRERTGSLIPR